MLTVHAPADPHAAAAFVPDFQSAILAAAQGNMPPWLADLFTQLGLSDSDVTLLLQMAHTVGVKAAEILLKLLLAKVGIAA